MSSAGRQPMIARVTSALTAPRRALAIALALGVLATALVLHNQRDVGIPRDETVYMHAGPRYADWWTGLFTGQTELSSQSITAHFGGKRATDNNREHPPLVKTLAGFSERLLHEELGWLDELTAFRLPSAALHGLLVALVMLFAAASWGLAAGVVSALLLLLMPRPLFHAGLLCFDGPITALWFATIAAYHRALVTGRRAWLAGVCFGLALATKHNALLLPFCVAAHYAITAWRRGAPLKLGALWALRPRLALSMMLLGPAVLFALWPWLWLSPARHVAEWIAFHRHHVHYNFEYLGQNWNAPPFPWHVPLVTTWLTVPAVTLASALVGLRVMARWRRTPELPARAAAADAPTTNDAPTATAPPLDAELTAAATAPDTLGYGPALLLLLSAAASMGLFMTGSTPIFGAEKHWEPAIPSLCIAAGVGLVAIGRGAARFLAARVSPGRFAHRRASDALVAALAAAVLASAAVETFHPQPYGLTAYNSLAGGAPGAADLGMNRQFWGNSARGVLPWISRFAPPAGAPDVPVYSHDASPAWNHYARLGLSPRGLPDAGHDVHGIAQSSIAFVIHELHFARIELLIWQAYGTAQPSFVLRLDGVPLISVYLRPGVLR